MGWESRLRMPAPEPALFDRPPPAQLEGVTYCYPGAGVRSVRALDGISLVVTQGETVGLLGPTGAGKTTLMEILAGLLTPDNGTITRAPGSDTTPPAGMVFQFPEQQLFAETVAQDVAFGPHNFNTPADEVDRRVAASLTAVGLPPADFGGRSPFDLSAGERRRVAVAGVLALNARLLLLDEPTVGLDQHGVADLRTILNGVRAAGTTVVFVSHDMDFVASICERIVALLAGRVVYDGSRADFFRDPALLARLRMEPPMLRQYLDALPEPHRSAVADVWDLPAARERLRASGYRQPERPGMGDFRVYPPFSGGEKA